jgi:nucleoside-diphosphate kinase
LFIDPEALVVERTLAILKPDCVKKNLQGEVLSRIQKAGFKVLGLKQLRLTKETAGAFYAVHKGKPFYDGLVEFMSSGPCVPIALQRENAVAEFRKLIGATDPKEAVEGTIRKQFADNKGENIVHGSDTPENGRIEVAFFYSERELAESM